MDKTSRLDWSCSYSRGANGVGNAFSGTISQSNTRVGSKNPGWKKRLQDQLFTAAPYNCNFLEISKQEGSCGLHWFRNNQDASGHKFVEECWCYQSGTNFANSLGIPVDPFSSQDVSKAQATAYSHLLDRVRTEHSEMNAPLFLGELLETVRMIRRPAAGLLDGLRAYATATKRLAASTRTRRAFQKGLPALYLEMVFGWKPLMSDIHDIARTAGRILTDPIPLKRITSRVEVAPVTTVYTSSGLGPFDCKQNLVSRFYATKSVQCTAYLKETLTGPSAPLDRVRELSGFTLENFVPTVYNLIPYSFVIDYFSNLGDVISGACTDQSKVIGMVQSTRTQLLRQERLTFDAGGTIAAVGGFGHSPFGTTSGALELKVTKIERTIAGSIPVPDLQFVQPGGQQFLNLEALIAGMFSDVRPPRR
jgi:hypothetical protein